MIFDQLNNISVKTRFKIKDMPKDLDYDKMPFGRRIEFRHQLEAFKAQAKTTHLSQKRQHYSKAIREFVKLNNVTQYFCQFHASKDYYDDSFQFWYV